VAGCCEGGDESSGSIKCREFIDLLRNSCHLKRSVLTANIFTLSFRRLN
jgi:hypothetical protein